MDPFLSRIPQWLIDLFDFNSQTPQVGATLEWDGTKFILVAPSVGIVIDARFSNSVNPDTIDAGNSDTVNPDTYYAEAF